jgi:hypothetical protein
MASSCLAVGPNMLSNSGLEGGSQQFNLQVAFTIISDSANAHTGQWVMRADLTRSWLNAYQIFTCWPNTDYTSSVWYKGTGTLTFQILGGDGKTVIKSSMLTSAAGWQKATITWNSGNYTKTMIGLDDNVGNGVVYLDDFYTGLTGGQTLAFNANDPSRSAPRFNLLFDDEFNSTSTIDVNNTGKGGYDWYLQSFFDPKYNNNSSMFSVGGGVLTLKDAGTPWSEVLDSAHPYKNDVGFIGTVFSGGRGLYAVARIQCLNTAIYDKTGWPSWWSYDIKGETKLHQDMPGNPGHTEIIENDFMEYNPSWRQPADWNSTMHDWCDANLSNSNSIIAPPSGTDYTRYHTYGVLWVPASAANGWIGYRQAYFDGIPEQAVCWVGNQTYTAGVFPETVESMGSYLFSLTDHDQFMLILGGTQGGTPSMNVDYVRVYAVDKSSMTVVKP